MSYQELVQIGIRNGWIKPPPKRVRVVDVERRNYMRIYRIHRHCQGLTSEGTPRRNVSWPELKGLSNRDYHTQYMRIWRLRGGDS